MSLLSNVNKEGLAANLLGNAINFTEEGGTISVNLEKKNNHVNNNNKEEEVLVSVKDTGIGIDEEIMLLLFRKFVTVSMYLHFVSNFP